MLHGNTSKWNFAFALLGATLLVGGCGPGAGRGPNPGGGTLDLAPPSGWGLDGGTETPTDLMFNPDAFWAQDPPLMFCGFDGGPPPVIPGGTPQCPDDKNREGCPCTTVGMTASCWPGLRANRNLGQCMDGMTTCVKQGELSVAWGPCMGYVLPTPGVTSGAGACKCFSAGQWHLDNLSPCMIDSGTGFGSGGAISTYIDNTGKPQCPANSMVKPTQPWTTDQITADCMGHFKLCYTLKAGDVMNPSPNDCVLAQSCSEGDYTMVNNAQKFPPLPGWLSTDTACATAFAKNGYGEMSVDGTTYTCDKVQSVFLRVGYCPQYCANPMDPMYNAMVCSKCMTGGSGNF
jgi:hypothetical protein